MDPKLPRPGLRAHWTWIGVLCTLLGSVVGRFFLNSSHDVPPPRRADPEGDRPINEALLSGRILDSLRQRAADSPATQRRADEAATRTYDDAEPAPAEQRAPSRRPAPHRWILSTPAPQRPLPSTPAPQRPLLFTPAPQRPLLFTPAPQRPRPSTPAPQRPRPSTPAPQRPLLFTPAPQRPLLFTPAPQRSLPSTPAPPSPLPFTPAPSPRPFTPAPMSPLPAPTPTPAGARPAPSQPVAAEVTDLTPLPDSIGNLYFIGLYHNTGEATIDLPRAELTLWSRDGQKLAAATGFTSRHQLPAGESTPLKVLFTKAPPYATMTAQVSPKRELYPRHRPQLELSDIQLGRDRFAGYRVAGTVHNRGPAAAQYVQLTALLYDAEERLAGLDSRFTAQRVLPAGASTPFEVTVGLVRGVPRRVQLDYQALEVAAGAPQSR